MFAELTSSRGAFQTVCIKVPGRTRDESLTHAKDLALQLRKSLPPPSSVWTPTYGGFGEGRHFSRLTVSLGHADNILVLADAGITIVGPPL